MTTSLTDPENKTERSAGWKAVSKVRQCGGCFCCLNRDRQTEGWGTAGCGLRPERRFDECVRSGHFSPDYARIYSQENVE